MLARTLEADPAYRLAAAISGGHGNGTYYVWVNRDQVPHANPRRRGGERAGRQPAAPVSARL